MKSNLRFCRRQCWAVSASAILGDPLEPWRNVRDASPHAGGGGGGPVHHHNVGRPGEPPGRWLPLLVARVGWLLAILDHPLRYLATTSDCGGARGPRWWWWRTRWWKRRRRGGNGSDEFGDDLGETTLIDLGWNAALSGVKYNWWHNKDQLPLASPMERCPTSNATAPRFESCGRHIFLVFSFFFLLIFILYFIYFEHFSVWIFFILFK
jgi:hypothetical protein